MAAIAGFGLGVRREHLAELAATTRPIDFVEIIPENWLRPWQARQLAPIRARWPVVPHSIHLSIGGPDPIDEAFVAAMATMARDLDAPFYSDHVCFSSVGGRQTGELLPLPFSDEALAHTLPRIAAVRARLPVPLVLENPTYYAVMPGSTMTELAFLTTLLREADIGLLLDVNNVYVNSQNHGYDPYAFIDGLPLARVAQVHLAGYNHARRIDTLVDTHGAAVTDPVWELYAYTVARAGRILPTIIEWDFNLPTCDALIDEVERARSVATRALAAGGASAARGVARHDRLAVEPDR